MYEVIEGIFIGNDEDCELAPVDWATIHACKHPCYYRAVGLQFKGYKYSESLVKEHPEYLVYRVDSDLFLNIIDVEDPSYFPRILFDSALEFLAEHYPKKKILVHCNEGFSRSPSIVLLFLAKQKLIPDSNYEAAKKEFEEEFYNHYFPNSGIFLYLKENWQLFIKK